MPDACTPSPLVVSLYLHCFLMLPAFSLCRTLEMCFGQGARVLPLTVGSPSRTPSKKFAPHGKWSLFFFSPCLDFPLSECQRSSRHLFFAGVVADMLSLFYFLPFSPSRSLVGDFYTAPCVPAAAACNSFAPFSNATEFPLSPRDCLLWSPKNFAIILSLADCLDVSFFAMMSPSFYSPFFLKFSAVRKAFEFCAVSLFVSDSLF